jgi:hypothetical protein
MWKAIVRVMVFLFTPPYSGKRRLRHGRYGQAHQSLHTSSTNTFIPGPKNQYGSINRPGF